MFRSDEDPLRLGDSVELDDFTAVVTKVDRRGRATVVEFRFHEPLDAAHLRWVAWDGRRFVDVTLPAVGAASTLGEDRTFWVPEEAP